MRPFMQSKSSIRILLPAGRGLSIGERIAPILARPTSMSVSGFPCISHEAFQDFQSTVPHLFRNGLEVLRWLNENQPQPAEEDLTRAFQVTRSLVLTAGVCAPPDLWVLRNVLQSCSQTGILEPLLNGGSVSPTVYARGYDLPLRRLLAELNLLHVRGYLDRQDDSFALSTDKMARTVISYAIKHLVKSETISYRIILALAHSLGSREHGGADTVAICSDFLLPTKGMPKGSQMSGWVAGPLEIEVGYRIVPLILALCGSGVAQHLTEGVAVREIIPAMCETMIGLLQESGFVEQEGRMTLLGARSLARGGGPCGIIHSYYPYFKAVESRSAFAVKEPQQADRTENIVHSQEANRQMFRQANRLLDAFCAHYDYQYHVFIEHAMGLGEASRQRFAKDGADFIRYVGAEIDDTALQEAKCAVERGELPLNMLFVSEADIGLPKILLGAVKLAGLSGSKTVMMVGNGFHEVRQQTNEKMISIFRCYQEAGILLVFTEETALDDAEICAAGWNTYHAGFRFVHEISGQELRPSQDQTAGKLTSWRLCVEQAGYIVVDDFCFQSRRIYPTTILAENPPISATYFCVPERTAVQLSIKGKTK